jgi:hypothetical protein
VTIRMRAKYVDVRIASGRGVADRWLSQYCKDGKWNSAPLSVKGHTSQQVHDALCELGENPPINKVAEIIGNKAWSYISCDGCPEYVEKAVAIGEYEPKAYCRTCLAEAFAAMNDEASAVSGDRTDADADSVAR